MSWPLSESISNIHSRGFLSYIGGTLLEAGTETTSVTLQSFILCMTARPDVQVRAQKEIDQVIGSNRTPGLNDLKDLPYVQALIKEVSPPAIIPLSPLSTPYIQLYRYRPVGPTAVPHATTADERVRCIISVAGSFTKPLAPDRRISAS